MSRVAALKNKNAALQRENEQLMELYSFLHSRPEAEAREVFDRIRASNDPFAVLQLVKQGDLLLNPFQSGNVVQEEEKLKQDTFQCSYHTVPSRFWAAVAGDGVVSALITSFFKWDEPFSFPSWTRICSSSAWNNNLQMLQNTALRSRQLLFMRLIPSVKPDKWPECD